MTVRVMSMLDGVRKGLIAGLISGLALVPAWPAKAAAHAREVVTVCQDPQGFAESDSDQDVREREQEKRDREQEARDRQQEKKDREQERVDRLQGLYDEARDALDEEKYVQAAEKFNALVQMNGPQTDAAIYWKAYAENRQGKRDAALATVAELKRRYPQSRWKRDGEALEIEIKNRVGTPVKVDDASDDEIFILAFQGLMNSNPEAGIKKRNKSSAVPLRRRENRRCYLWWHRTAPKNLWTCLARSRKAKAIPTCSARLLNS